MTNPPLTPPENTEPVSVPQEPEAAKQQYEAPPQEAVNSQHQQVPPVYQAPPIVQQPVKAAEQRNVLGIIAFIVAVVGFIFACIPGALILGWVLLPIAFILSLVSLFLKGKGKGLGVAGLIISIVGTIVGVVVFLAVVSTAFDDAFSGGDTSVAVPESSTEDSAAVADEVEAEVSDEGTRANPYPIGTVITQGDWAVTINSVDLDATDAITNENMFNDAPDAGTVYILINMTATYNGTNPEGEMPWAMVDYVTADGNTIDGTDKFIVAPDSFDSMSTMYEGASTSGNRALQVPADSAADGVLAVSPAMFGEKVFVAVK